MELEAFMKFYSEITGELFDTIEELELTEKSIREKEAAEKKANKEIEKAYDDAVKAWKNYLEQSKKYGRRETYMPEGLFKDFIGTFF